MQTAETVEAIVTQLMEKQRVARQAALVKQLECGCPDSTCADGKTCSHPMRRITAAKGDPAVTLPSSSSNARTNNDNNNQVSSTTGSGSMLLTNNHSQRVYAREPRNHQNHNHQAGHNPGNTPPLVLSLSQIQGGGGLLILNSNSSATANSATGSHKSLVTPVSVASFVCSTNARKNDNHAKSAPLILKQEDMETSAACAQKRDAKMEVTSENLRQSLFESIAYSRQDRSVSQQTEVIMTSAPSTPSKKMDTNHEDDFKQHQSYCGETVVLLGPESRNSLISKADGFFNETLDLTQEDIQRTLSANMPLCSNELERQQQETATRNRVISIKTPQPQHPNHQHTTMTPEINPMDFIDSCDVVVSPTHVVDDDVFVNLDAFDMLGEFPDLEALDSGHHELLDVNPSDEARSSSKSSGDPHQANIQLEATAKITDYSPEWAYPEGGVKVLVTGPWHSSGPYTVLFDTFPVPTTLVQSGVLRCYCPGKAIFYKLITYVIYTRNCRNANIRSTWPNLVRNRKIKKNAQQILLRFDTFSNADFFKACFYCTIVRKER